MKKITWFALVLVVLATWLPSSDAIWKYLFFLRLPILMGLFLLLLPKLAKDWLPAMLKSLFILRDKWQLATIIVSAIGAGTSVILVTSIILDNSPARFSVPATIKIPEFWQYGIAIALSLYICIVAIDLSQEKLNKNEIWWGASVGTVLSIGLLFILGLLRQWLSSNTFLNKIVVDIFSFISKNHLAGYINPQTGELAAGHLTAIAYLIIGLTIYLTVGLVFNPKPAPNRPEAPALLYVLMLVSTTVIIYGGATFYLDYFRVPILVLFIAFSGLSYLAFDVNHFFQLNTLNESKDKKRVDSDSGDFKQVLDKRLKSLDAVGWGMAYLDVWRFIGLPFLIRPKFDRGTAVEIDWQAEMKEPKKSKTLATWRKQIFDGEIPIPVFNATLVENGWRFLMTPMTFCKLPNKKYLDFNSLYGAYDMNVVTAARLSATFPYVSPICRNSINIPDRNYHVADGGYFDNSGFVTAAEWLDEQLNEWLPENSLNIKRVLILQINAFPESPSTEKVQGDGGWFMATIGPLLATFKVRDSVLSSRNAKEAELLAQKWQNKVDIQYFPIFFPSASDAPEFYKTGQYRPPLSWRLTDKEKKAIKEGWTAITTGKTIKKIKHLWHETWNM